MRRLKCSDKSIAITANSVKNGNVVVFPTDTVYGIGCDPYNDSAVGVVFEIKERKEENPLPLLCSSVQSAYRICNLNKLSKELAEQFWPGALTLISQLIDTKISRKVTAGTNKIGVRIPNHSCAVKLIEACGGILVGTSANPSGSNAAKSADEVVQTINGFDILLDGGKTQLGTESTVIDVSEGRLVLIREGYIKRERIEKVLGRYV
ncbi:MAG: L-threonylcarbamoyladenylate synthase [Nitrososphaerales archaeon]